MGRGDGALTVTNATQLVNPGVTSLAHNATSFTPNSATAGAPLTAGTSYFLRIRPNVGTQWFPYDPAKNVTATGAATGYAAWVSAQYPVVTGGLTGDHGRDGLANAVEYAFGLNPTVANSSSALPQPILAGNTYRSAPPSLPCFSTLPLIPTNRVISGWLPTVGPMPVSPREISAHGSKAISPPSNRLDHAAYLHRHHRTASGFRPWCFPHCRSHHPMAPLPPGFRKIPGVLSG
jgi:hypothetical protein